MKAKLFVLILLVGLASVYNASSQSPGCAVLKPEISERYEGGCKNGLAHGKGIAEGVDLYKGRFKQGLPHGYGNYTWENGDKYSGFWRNGLMSGEGEFACKTTAGIDSTYKGRWSKGKLVKRIYPQDYVVFKSENVIRYTVQKVKTGNRVVFAFKQNGRDNPNITLFDLGESNGTPFSLGNKRGVENVLFPFNCRVFYFTTNSLRTANFRVLFDIQINQPGEWLITLHN